MCARTHVCVCARTRETDLESAKVCAHARTSRLAKKRHGELKQLRIMVISIMKSRRVFKRQGPVRILFKGHTYADVEVRWQTNDDATPQNLNSIPRYGIPRSTSPSHTETFTNAYANTSPSTLPLTCLCLRQRL